ncbi:MAG: roadblock/LC7 domain-containing protein [Chloroflexaceae bacterium]
MSRSSIVLSPSHLAAIQHLLAQLGQQADVRCAFLGDLSGQELASWEDRTNLDIGSLAALAAGDLMATMEIAQLLGGKRTCNLIIQEHDDMTILVSRVGEGLFLLLATARDVPLGWSRLAIKRTAERILTIVGKAAMTPPPSAVNDDFVHNFAAHLDNIW